MNGKGEKIFRPYLELVERADVLFSRVCLSHGHLVRCRLHCWDCCTAYFELTPIEALYIHRRFHQDLGRTQRRTILRRARKAELTFRRIQTRIQKMVEQHHGDDSGVSDWVARERVDCPFLSDRKECELYDHRPITCRLYGVPMVVGGASRTCGRSGFREGDSYPTIDMDRLQERLIHISEGLVMDGWRWARTMPLSSVLLADLSPLSIP